MVCARVCALRRLQANHKDGGTGGLLALNYQTVPDLPQNFGMVVTGQKVRRRFSGFQPPPAHASPYYPRLSLILHSILSRKTVERGRGLADQMAPHEGGGGGGRPPRNHRAELAQSEGAQGVKLTDAECDERMNT